MDFNRGCITFISKLNIEERNIYVKVLWKQNETDLFHIKIVEGDWSWSGRYSNEFAEKYADCVDESKAEYITNVRLFLSGNSDQCVFDFSGVVGDPEAYTFTWRKTFKGSTATRLHGSVPVHRDETAISKDNIIDYLLTENKELRSIVASLNDKTDTLSTDLIKCKKDMEKYVDIKTSLEASLYGKFVQLLNAKKRRIQLLEEHVKKFEHLDQDIDM